MGQAVGRESQAEGKLGGAVGAAAGCGSQAEDGQRGAAGAAAGRGSQAEGKAGGPTSASAGRGSRAEDDLGWHSDSQRSMEPSPGKEPRRCRDQRRNGDVSVATDDAIRVRLTETCAACLWPLASAQ